MIENNTEELVFDEVIEKSSIDKQINDSDSHYRKMDIARTNLDAKRTDGEYIASVGNTKSELIKTLKEVLGTMVQEPEYTKDPNDIGGKPVFKMYIQKPIIEGEDRKKVLDKLIQLVDSL